MLGQGLNISILAQLPGKRELPSPCNLDPFLQQQLQNTTHQKGHSNSQIWLWWPNAEACSSCAVPAGNTMCLSSYLWQLWTLQWGAIGNWQPTHSDAALPLKLLLVWGGKKCGIGKSLSLLRKPVLRNTAAYFLRTEHTLILPSHPQGRLKGM